MSAVRLIPSTDMTKGDDDDSYADLSRFGIGNRSFW
ncbi:hypothetical protein Enr17x_14820 [Gimesia fumaroli]|uniref:Uncharacterized protein n=1 Tax=Gimesia fumaroli TaxID=2527976 RepID=A0A518I8S8_9PLAN|nr:hypothetical protein Enr17x_14820 [Gimesia fumaroli]